MLVKTIVAVALIQMATHLPETGALGEVGEMAREVSAAGSSMVSSTRSGFAEAVPYWTGGAQLLNADMLNRCDGVVWTTGRGVKLGKDTEVCS